MHYWRMLKASKFNVVHCGPSAAAVWLFAGHHWRPPEAMRGGLKPHSEEFWCHIKGQAFSLHLCAGHKGKHPPTPKGLAGALGRCIFKTHILPAFRWSHWTRGAFALPRGSHASTLARAGVRAPKEYFPRHRGFRRCRAGPGVEHFRGKAGRSLGAGGFSRRSAFVHALKEEVVTF